MVYIEKVGGPWEEEKLMIIECNESGLNLHLNLNLIGKRKS